MSHAVTVIAAGTEVLISGLVSRPEINNTTGIVLLYNEPKERYGVKLPGGEELLLRPDCLAVREVSDAASDFNAPANIETLQGRIARVEAAVLRAEKDMASEGTQPVRLRMNAPSDEWDFKGIRVVLGTPVHASQPQLIEQITVMINSAYYEANKPFLPPTQTTYDRVDAEEVHGRLMMGSAGSLNSNRVMLLAFVDDKLAGACSSTFSVPWAEDGCGHWGLLVSDVSMRGLGVATALVATAEQRVASKCTAVRMEYEYVPNDPHSERLLSWYEGTLGFTCIQARQTGGGCQWRTCQKDLPTPVLNAAELDRLRQTHRLLTNQLSLTSANKSISANATV